MRTAGAENNEKSSENNEFRHLSRIEGLN